MEKKKKDKKSGILLEKTWIWLRKANRRRESESLLIAIQNNIVRTNYLKAIDKTQQNRSCRLCGDREKTIDHIISKCSKFSQREYKTRHDWAVKMIG